MATTHPIIPDEIPTRMALQIASSPGNGTCRRAIEFLTLFAVAPILHTSVLPNAGVWAPIVVMLWLSPVLLALTPGALRPARFALPAGTRTITAGLAITAVIGAIVASLWLTPADVLALPRNAPQLWLLILTVYPIASAAAQELFYRGVFFERYGDLFPSQHTAVTANALVFAGAHLSYASVGALTLSFLTGLGLAWLYTRTRSILATWLVHAVAGQAAFTFGVGELFRHGAL